MKKTLLQEISYWSGVLIVGLVVGLGIQFVRAWVEPTAEAPGGNLGAPINTGNIGQYKTGNLALNTDGTWVNGLLIPNGKVGIGTNTPTQKLDVAGQVHASGDICTDAGGGKCLSDVGGTNYVSGGLYGYCRSYYGPTNGCADALAPATCAYQADDCRCPSGFRRVDIGLYTQFGHVNDSGYADGGQRSYSCYKN